MMRKFALASVAGFLLTPMFLSNLPNAFSEDLISPVEPECTNLDTDDLTLSLDNLSYRSFNEPKPRQLDISNNANSIQPYIFCSEAIADSEIDYRFIPKGARLYKAMSIPPGGFLEEDNILNKFVNSYSWLGSRATAESYANSDWGQENGYQVVEFEAVKDLKLFELNVYDNIQYLWDSLQSDLDWHQSNADTITQEIPDLVIQQRALDYNDLKIRERELWLDVLRLTMGINTDYDEQIKLLRQYGNVITNDYSYHPEDEIAKRLGSNPPNSFYFTHNDNPSVPYEIQGADAQWGPATHQLNRISFVTDIDKILCEIIATYTNADGYIAPDMFSLWHKDGRLAAEIAVFKARDTVAINQRDPSATD
ncbi:MAG: hypothetical protein QNJ46_03680 [Leptolyngbyaceae cyanobacterium MO_188.B28]|nr:hypothetical protein [Leptolyngbyaceae cyanobacterium MO_188.B28]